MAFPPSVYKTWIAGETLTAADLNNSMQVIPNSNIPEDIDDFSVNATEMQTQTDPGESGSESLATSLSEELARLRFAHKDATGKTYWYQTPSSTIETIVNGTQTFAGAKTFSSAVNFTATSNHIYLTTAGAGRAIISAASIATTDRVYSFPDISANGTVALLEGSQTFTGAKTFGTGEFSVTSRAIFTGSSVDIGTSGDAGTLDIYPATSAKGVLRIVAADNTGNSITTLTQAAQGGAYTYTIPDGGASCEILLTRAAQTIVGVKTFPAGSEAAPGLVISSAGNGFWSGGSNIIDVSINGTKTWRYASSSNQSYADLIPGTDNTYKCGQLAARFTEVFAVAGSINTCHSSEKYDIRDLADDFVVPMGARFKRNGTEWDQVGYIADPMQPEAFYYDKETGKRSETNVYGDAVIGNLCAGWWKHEDRIRKLEEKLGMK